MSLSASHTPDLTLLPVLDKFFIDHFKDSGPSVVALACSGGPDSLALLRTLSDWSVLFNNVPVHALIVDHGLRDESMDEAKHVRGMVHDWPNVQAHILTWAHDGVDTAVQAAARTARYDLMAKYCAAHNIGHLFLGHHQDDQAETVLMRLAAGSGLNGLTGMRPVSAYSEGLALCRPFLSVPKNDLVALCDAYNIEYVHDPSNTKDTYTRVRLRGSMDVLSAEGLTAKRLATTAMRLARAREALEEIADEVYGQALIARKKNQTIFSHKIILHNTKEIGLRVILRAIRELRPDAPYNPRMEKIEALFDDLIAPAPFRKRTLGGLVFERDDDAEQVLIYKEG